MLLRNLRSNQVVSEKVQVASHFASRFFGLMGKKTLSKENSLLLTSCNSIHTCFMRFTIDVVFVDKDMKVIAIKEKIKPWRFTWPVVGAKSAIEFAAQKISSQMKLGDQLHVGN